MILYIGKIIIKLKIIKLTNELSKAAGYKSKTKLNYIFIHLHDQCEKKKLREYSIHNSMKYNKIFRNTFSKKSLL